MKHLVRYALLLMLPVTAWAQSASPDAMDAPSASASHWSLGVGMVASDHAYVGKGTQVTPFPLLGYEGERFFFRGITGGMHLWKGDGLVFDAIVTTGFNTIQADDFGRAELARRGIDRDDLDDRDRSIDVGLAATWTSAAGRLRLEAKSDVSGTSKGQEYALTYGYRWQLGGFRVEPELGVNFLSSKVADYYYGIHAQEVQRGVPGYRPGSALIPEVGIGMTRPLGARWVLMLKAKYQALPSKISDSPLVDGSHGSSLFVGFSRVF